MPAAVINSGNNFGSAAAASNTAWYPATVACELRMSIFCARVMRGIKSIAKLVTLPSASLRTRSSAVVGCRLQTNVVPLRNGSTSLSAGGRTRNTKSALP